MPCLIELGKESKNVHYKIGENMAGIVDLAIITTIERFKDIKDGAANSGMEDSKVIFSEKPQEILHAITTFCKSGDVVLLEGRVPSDLIKLLTDDKQV